jgi:hypothetical protein
MQNQLLGELADQHLVVGLGMEAYSGTLRLAILEDHVWKPY